MELDKIEFDIKSWFSLDYSSKESFEVSEKSIEKARNIFYGFEEEIKQDNKETLDEIQKEIDSMGPIVIKSNEEEERSFQLRKPVVTSMKK